MNTCPHCGLKRALPKHRTFGDTPCQKCYTRHGYDKRDYSKKDSPFWPFPVFVILVFIIANL